VITISVEDIIFIHDSVIEPEEIQGLAKDKSLEAAIARIENRLQYGLVNDVFELASLYALVLSTGHCFNDANKRTAANVMDVCLTLNGVELSYEADELGEKIILLAQGKLDEFKFAKWLKELEFSQRS